MNYNKLDPLIEPLMGAVRRAERFLGPEDDWVEGLKRRIVTKIHPLTAPLGRPLIKEKPDAEQFATTDVDCDMVRED